MENAKIINLKDIVVTITVSKVLKIRLWLGVAIIKLGCRIASFSVEIKNDIPTEQSNEKINIKNKYDLVVTESDGSKWVDYDEAMDMLVRYNKLLGGISD